MFYAIVVPNAVIAAFALWLAVDYFVRQKAKPVPVPIPVEPEALSRPPGSRGADRWTADR